MGRMSTTSLAICHTYYLYGMRHETYNVVLFASLEEKRSGVLNIGDSRLFR